MKSTAFWKNTLSNSPPESILPHSFKTLLMTNRIFLCSSDKIVVGFFINLTLTYRRRIKKSSDVAVGGLFSDNQLKNYSLYSIGSLADSLIINFAITIFPDLSLAAASSDGLKAPLLLSQWIIA